MITNNKNFSCNTKSVISFISEYQSKYLKIPNNYQRDYAWFKKSTRDPNGRSHLEVFLSDFYQSYIEDKYLIFGNNVAITESGSIADGQQRITSIFLLGIYLANNVKEKNNYIDNFKNSLNGDLKLRQSCEIIDEWFQESLLNPTEEAMPCFQEAYAQISNFFKGKEITADLWKHFSEKIYLHCIQLEEDQGKQYFDDVNAKGCVLNRVDVLKDIFIQSGVSVDDWEDFSMKIIPKLENYYSAGSGNSTTESFLEYALYTLGYNENNSGLTSTKLIDFITKKINDSDRIKLFSEIVILAKLSIVLYTKPKYYFLTKVSKTIFIPVIRKLILNGFTPEAAYNRALYITLTSNMSAKSTTVTMLKFCNTITPNNDIKFDLEKIYLDKFTYKKGGNVPIKVALLILESYFNKNALSIPVVNNKNLTIEHISSQQFDLDNVHTLGNLTLLTKSENSSLNKEQEKYNVYKKSEYCITKLLCLDGYRETLKDHQRRFANEYFPGKSSAALDVFNIEDFKDREIKIFKAIYQILIKNE